jgi:hypothetical protein
MIKRFWNVLASLRLTVVCLAISIVVIFIGTVAQADEGLYEAQERYFKQWWVWGPMFFGFRLPILLPGGYLLGTVLVVNLVAAHSRRFTLSVRKIGIHLTHLGVVVLLLGQLMTDMLSVETFLRLQEGESKSFTEMDRAHEVVLVRDPGGENEWEVAFPASELTGTGELAHPEAPFVMRLKDYHPNSEIHPGEAPESFPPDDVRGDETRPVVVSLPVNRELNAVNVPSATVEVVYDGGRAETLVLSPWLGPREIIPDSTGWLLVLRPARVSHPFTVTLLETTHEVYPGTEIPRDFRSRIRIDHPARNETREVDIFMNNPLRYEGLTFYQHQMGQEESGANAGRSILLVVHNPARRAPYLGCLLVATGLTYQFLLHLGGFLTWRRSEGWRAGEIERPKG